MDNCTVNLRNRNKSDKTEAGGCAVSTNPPNLKRTKKMQGRQGDIRSSRYKFFLVLETVLFLFCV